MVAPPIKPTSLDEATLKEIAIGGTLVGLFDSTDPKAFKTGNGVPANASEVKFYDKNDKENPFKTYNEFGKNNSVTDTSRVAITVPGETEPRYYKKIYQSIPDHKAADKSDKPKLVVWARTDKDGNLFVDKDGKVERYDTYAGFKGDVNLKNKQTDAARSAEAGKLYSPAAQIDASIKEAYKNFDEEVKKSKKAVKGVETKIVAHSFGTPNAIVAGGIMGDRAKSVLLLEHITAKGHLDMLSAMKDKPQELATALNINESEAKNFSINLKTLEKKTISMRSTDKDGNLTNAAMLEVFDSNKHKSLAALHTKNVGDNYLSNLISTGARPEAKRNLNDPKKIDRKMRGIGTEIFLPVADQTRKKYPAQGLIAGIDRDHKVIMIVGEALEQLKKIADRKKALEKENPVKKPNQTSWDAAIERAEAYAALHGTPNGGVLPAKIDPDSGLGNIAMVVDPNKGTGLG